MKRLIFLILITAGACAWAQEEETCGDGWLIFELPAKAAAARKACEEAMDSGVTSEMRPAAAQYNEALKAMILELGKTYYAKPPTKSEVNDLEKALITRALFAQNADNPRGEPLGTIAPLEVVMEAGDGLEQAIVRMVKALIGEGTKYSFAEWLKSWNQAVARE
jgi:hypothetical protein